MRHFVHRWVAAALVVLTLTGILPAALATPAEPVKGVTILFTHDTHSHFLPDRDDAGNESGGYTRLMTALKAERAAAYTPVFTLDGGDFSMGTLFQTIYATDAAELRALGAMGYDAVTLGNHEFDYRAAGFASMLNAARSGVAAERKATEAALGAEMLWVDDGLPELVAANYKPPLEDEKTWSAWNDYGIKDYTMIERDGIRMAVFGIMGNDADETAPMSGMVLEDPIQAAKRVVEEIKSKESYDFIVCLSHSGTSGGKGEDYDLAKGVDGIDVIISGHTHTTLPQPIVVGNTVIVSAGAYTANLGVLTLGKDVSGKNTVDTYRLVPIDGDMAVDGEISDWVDGIKPQVERHYLKDYGMTFDQVLTTATFGFTPIEEFGNVQEEDELGNLIADSYIHVVKEAEGADYVPVDFAVVASGVVRGSFAPGDITVSDAFNVSSLGSGADGTPGYPLISVYLTGRELRDAFEVDASVAPIMSTAQLYGSGMTWSYNPNRMIFNKVTDCAQVLEDGTTVPLEDDRLYRCVTGLYSGQMLGAVNSKSFGLLTITPKDETGQPVTDFESRIIYNREGAEVKEWYALASYLDSMETIPAHYAAPEGRKVVAPSWNPVELLKTPNWITLAALALVLLILVIIVLVIVAVRRRSKRRAGNYRG